MESSQGILWRLGTVLRQVNEHSIRLFRDSADLQVECLGVFTDLLKESPVDPQTGSAVKAPQDLETGVVLGGTFVMEPLHGASA